MASEQNSSTYDSVASYRLFVRQCLSGLGFPGRRLASAQPRLFAFVGPCGDTSHQGNPFPKGNLFLRGDTFLQ